MPCIVAWSIAGIVMPLPSLVAGGVMPGMALSAMGGTADDAAAGGALLVDADIPAIDIHCTSDL